MTKRNTINLLAALGVLILMLVIGLILGVGHMEEDRSRHELLKLEKAAPPSIEKPLPFDKKEKSSYLDNVSGKTLAVIDVGNQRPVPQPLLDLVTVFLSDQRHMVVVERQAMEEILKEQALNLSMGNRVSPQRLVQVGKLLHADGLLMLEAGVPTNDRTTIRMRLVDAHCGFKLWDGGLLIKNDLTNIEKTVDTIMDLVLSRIPTSENQTTQKSLPTLIGISSFRSTEIRNKWDPFGDVIASSLEQHLTARPGVLLVERQKTGPLIMERQLTEGLPPALKASAILVEGTFRVDRTSGDADTENRLVLNILCRSGGKEVFRKDIHGNFDRPGELSYQAAEAIMEKLSLPKGNRVMAPEEEARFLVKQAEIRLQVEEPMQALPSIRSAIALAPGMFEPRVLLIRTVNQLMQDYERKYFNKKINATEREEFTRFMFPLCLQAIEAARFVLEHEKFPVQSKKGSNQFLSFYNRHTIFWTLHHQHGIFSYSRRIHKLFKKGKELHELLRVMNPGLKSAFKAYYRTTAKSTDNSLQLCLDNAIAESRYWFHTPEEAIAFIRSLVDTYDDAKMLPALQYQCIQSPPWMPLLRIHNKYFRLLEEFTASDSIMKQALAQRCYANFYLREFIPHNHEKGLQHFEQFVTLLETKVVPGYQDFGYLGLWVSFLHVPEGKTREYNAARIAPLMRRSIRAFFAPGLTNSGWRHLVDSTVMWSMIAGEQDEAVKILEEARDWLKKQKFSTYQKTFIEDMESKLKKLKARIALSDKKPRESLDTTDMGPGMIPFQAEEVLNSQTLVQQLQGTSALPSGLLMMGMVRTASHLGIICVDGPTEDYLLDAFETKRHMYNTYNGKSHIGILRLDPATFSVIGYTGLSGLNYGNSGRSHTSNMNSDNGPRRCADGDDVYLGLWDAGIIRFPADGSAPVHLTEKNGLVSNNIVSAMTAAGGKIYSLVRHSTLDWGLMETDFKTSQSRLLISPRGTDDQGDMQRMSLKTVVTEPGTSNLIIHAIPPHNDKRNWGMYRYNPRNKTAAWINGLWPGDYARIESFDDTLLFVSRQQVGTLKNVGEDSIIWYYLRKGCHMLVPYGGTPGRFYSKRTRNWKYQASFKPLKCALLPGERLFLLGSEGNNMFGSIPRDPWYMRLFTPNGPTTIEGNGVPPAERVVDIQKWNSNVLVLTKKKLNLISFY